MRPVACRLPAALAALSSSFHALAQPTTTETARVRYSAPPSCPGVETFRSGVTSRTDRIRFAETSTTLVFQVVVGENQGTFVGTLGIEHPGAPAAEPRRVDGARCAEVVESLALTAALSVDPDASLTPRRPPAPAPAPPPPLAEPAPPPPSMTEPATWRAALGPLYALVLTPGGMVGAYAEAGLSVPAGGGFHPLVSLDVSYATTSLLGVLEQAEARWLAGSAELCPARVGGGPHWITACAGGTLGVVVAHGTGLAEEREVSRFLPGAALGLRGHVGLDAGWALELRARALFPFVKRRFYVNTPDDVVASTATVAPLVSIGAVREF